MMNCGTWTEVQKYDKAMDKYKERGLHHGNADEKTIEDFFAEFFIFWNQTPEVTVDEFGIYVTWKFFVLDGMTEKKYYEVSQEKDAGYQFLMRKSFELLNEKL